MALIYTEFDTTLQNLVYDLRNAILTSTDWSKLNSTSVLVTNTANSAAGATTLTFTSGALATAGIVTGSIIRIGADGASDTEYRAVTGTTATTCTVAALTYAHNTGTNVYNGHEILQSTTTRGAKMIVDLTDGAPLLNALVMGVWQDHDGTTGTNKSSRWCYFRANTTAITQAMQVHVAVSASKEHLFVSLEGPRAAESLATSATVGSARNYFFMDDVIPYFPVVDTNPVCYAGGASTAIAGASVSNNSHLGNLSRNYANSSPWAQGILQTLDFPSLSSLVTVGVTRLTSGDSNYYLAPYVIFESGAGLRGRLRSLFFAGYNSIDNPDQPLPPIASRIQYGGGYYKLLPVNKADASNDYWNQLGSATNGTSTTVAHKSVVVAVPCLSTS